MNRRTIALVASLTIVAGCGTPPASGAPGASATPAGTPAGSPAPSDAATPTSPASPLPSGDESALYRQIEDQVVAERGLPAKQRLEPTILSEADLKARTTAMFSEDNPPAQVAETQETLVAFGLLPPGDSLQQLYVDMLGSQVAGFYDPKAKQLFVVSKTGAIGPTEKVTFAHEFTHALQDQSFGLAGIDVDAVGQGDRSLARLALVEGDASLLMTRWLVDHLSPTEIQQLLVIDPAAQAQLDALPAILRDTLLFPYQQGLTFVTAAWGKGGWPAVDAMYQKLPESTEQILHPQKYAAGEQPVPVPLTGARLAASMGAGWTATPEDTLGEYQLSIVLQQNGVPAAQADAAAAGWGGDRFAYLRGPGGAYALELLTTWDTQADSSEFLAAATTAASHLPGAAQARVPPSGANRLADRLADPVELLIASDASTLAQLRATADSTLP